MDHSANSHFDDGDDDERQGDAPSFDDQPLDFGSGSPDDDQALGETALGGAAADGSGVDDRWWGEQSHLADHVPAAATMLIAQLLDEPFVRDLADGLDLGGQPVEAEGAGQPITLEGGAALLQRHGIDAHVEHGDVAMLEEYVQEGRSVVVTVAADELSPSADADSSAPDRALVITGVDAAAGMLTAHDPSDANHEYQIRVDALEDAWADSANAMLVADLPAYGLLAELGALTEPTRSQPSGHAARADEDAERIRAWGSAGAAILPVLLGAGALIRRRKRA
jgi:hypothetical protein